MKDVEIAAFLLLAMVNGKGRENTGAIPSGVWDNSLVS
jgi:hypothetical protein